MAARVRIGVVGTSGWAEMGYLAGLRQHPGAELVAICGRDAARAATVARKYGIPRVCTDYRALIAQGGLDALAVVVPDDLHSPVTLAALDAGLHVLCEKPLAADARQARALYERAAAAGVVHMTHFTYRWFPPFIHLHHLASNGYLGRPYHCNIRYFMGYAGDPAYRWRYDARRANGALGDLGAHMIDLARWLCGDIAAVSAHLATHVAREGTGGAPLAPANDSAILTLAFRSGAQGAIHLSAVAHTGTSFANFQRQDVHLHGHGGALEAVVTLGGGEVRGAHRDEEVHPLPIPAALWGEVPPDNPAAVLSAGPAGARLFIEAIRAGRPAGPTFYDGWQAQEAIDAALRSHREGRWVPLDPPPAA